MFGKVKKWLGIEGVKVELVLPEEIKLSDGIVLGKLQFYSMNSQTVSRIHIKMIERYSRGRDDNRLVDEYKLGEITLNKDIEVPAGEPVEMSFELPFNVSTSRMDEIADQNPIFGGLVKVGKWFSKVKSVYRIEVEANAVGVVLNPFDRKIIQVK